MKQRVSWFCFPGDFFFFGLMKAPFGDYFFIFSMLLKQIQGLVLLNVFFFLKKCSSTSLVGVPYARPFNIKRTIKPREVLKF